MFPLRSGFAALLLVVPAAAAAQDSTRADTTPFHAGQWAALFSGGFSIASLGVLRFTAPTRAWLLDFGFSGGHSHNTSRVNDTLVVDAFTSNADVNAHVRRRFYQGRGKSVASFQTLGVLGGFHHMCQAQKPAPGFCDNGWNAGAFGELGGAYLITPRFSIGGTASVAFSYTRSAIRGSGGSVKSWAYHSSVQGLSFAATVYF